MTTTQNTQMHRMHHKIDRRKATKKLKIFPKFTRSSRWKRISWTEGNFCECFNHRLELNWRENVYSQLSTKAFQCFTEQQLCMNESKSTFNVSSLSMRSWSSWWRVGRPAELKINNKREEKNNRRQLKWILGTLELATTYNNS